MKWLRACLIFVAILASAPGAALRADMPGDVPDKLRIAAGSLFADVYTDGSYATNSAGLGGAINFEDTFNLPDNRDIFRAEANWHVAKRQFIDFGYFSLKRSGTSILDEDVSWGDYIYQAGGTVKAEFNSEFAYAGWRYLFLDLPEVRISGSAGFAYIDLQVRLLATGSVTDQNGVPVSGTVDETASVAAPVPEFGLQLDWALTRRLSILMYLRQLYINDIAGINGGINEHAIRLNWWYAKHAGISGGIEREEIDLKSYDNGDTKASFRYDVRSYSFYLTFAF